MSKDKLQPLDELLESKSLESIKLDRKQAIALRDRYRAEGAAMERKRQAAEKAAAHSGCGHCGSSTVEGCNMIGCGFLEAGNGEPEKEEALSIMDAAWKAYQDHPFDQAEDYDDETRKCVEAAVRAALEVSEPSYADIDRVAWSIQDRSPAADAGGLSDEQIDKAIEAFHEIKPLSGNEPLDWPEKFISKTREAMRAAIARCTAAATDSDALSNHKPGPWVYESSTAEGPAGIYSESGMVCTFYSEPSDADARLMVAAPGLLAASPTATDEVVLHCTTCGALPATLNDIGACSACGWDEARPAKTVYDELFTMYSGQCKTADEFAERARQAEMLVADATLTARISELETNLAIVNDRLAEEQRPSAVMAAVQDDADNAGFEVWAKSHGGLDMVKDISNEKGHLFPATYWSATTEIAWRAWANKPARRAAMAGGLSNDAEKWKSLYESAVQVAESAQRSADRRSAMGAGDLSDDPFMWAIMGPDGKVHFDEMCVSGSPGDLSETVYYLNEEKETGDYSVVPVFTRPTASGAAVLSDTERLDFIEKNSAYKRGAKATVFYLGEYDVPSSVRTLREAIDAARVAENGAGDLS